MIFVHRKNESKVVIGYAYCTEMSSSAEGSVNISTISDSQRDGDLEHITISLSVEQLFELSSVCKEAAKALAVYEMELRK